MLASLGKKLRLLTKTSREKFMADMGHDNEQPAKDVSSKVTDLDEAIQSQELEQTSEQLQEIYI